jgi:hypothetical protein
MFRSRAFTQLQSLLLAEFSARNKALSLPFLQTVLLAFRKSDCLAFLQSLDFPCLSSILFPIA